VRVNQPVSGVILALTGGVGGAKLVLGLARRLDPDALTVVVNTGDDFDHLGLRICPDIDTVVYTLAGLANPATGWGLAGDSWGFMGALQRLGGDGWFRLGDQDLATHVARTHRLQQGETLSAITADFCRSLGVAHAVAPMSDDPVRTVVRSAGGRIDFQDYLVRLRSEPVVEGFDYEGVDDARPSEGFLAGLNHPGLRAIVLCNSNPFVSILPILALPGIRERLSARRVPLIAVSPIVGGEAVKGPLAKMLAELGRDPSPLAIVEIYAGLLDAMVIDRRDQGLKEAIAALGVQPFIAETIMTTEEEKIRLADEVLEAAGTLSGSPI
jgi:LPPG:FO 2-phospho-L-lactate transferase